MTHNPLSLDGAALIQGGRPQNRVAYVLAASGGLSSLVDGLQSTHWIEAVLRLSAVRSTDKSMVFERGAGSADIANASFQRFSVEGDARLRCSY